MARDHMPELLRGSMCYLQLCMPLDSSCFSGLKIDDNGNTDDRRPVSLCCFVILMSSYTMQNGVYDCVIEFCGVAK